VPHVEDEAAYLFQAQVFAQGRLRAPSPPYPTSYWSPFVVDHGGWRFGKYPPGYPLLLSLGVLAGAPWVVNALLGSLALWLIAQAGRRIYSPTAGLLAAALGLACPVFLAESPSLLSHPTSLCFSSLFLWAMAAILDDGERSRRRWALLAGLGLGYLLFTRPFDVAGIGLPFALYALARAARGDRAPLRRGLLAASVIALFGLLLLLYWRRLTGSFVNPYRLVWPYDRPGFGLNAGLEGHDLATGLRYARHNLTAVARGWLGWPGYLNLLPPALPFLLEPRRRWHYLLLAAFLSLVAVHVTYWHYGGHDAGFPRYYYAGLPALLLLSARGLELLAGALGRLLRRIPLPGAGHEALARVSLYTALAVLVTYNALAFLPPALNAFRGKSGITAAPLEVVREAGVTGALVFVLDYQHWWDFAPFFAANSPTLDSGVVYAIYHDEDQARAVKALYPGRRCYVQTHARLLPCSF
jgi:hypothetical protein